jgi:outer membrane receptor protein involved in Fe transport
LGGAVVVLLVSTAVRADGPVDQSTAGTIELEEVVVTGSQIRGLQAPPTPTTVIDATDLRIGGHTDLGSVLSDLPSAKGTSVPTTNATTSDRAGASNVDLRGLGIARTLVLVDGRRPVPQDSRAAVDLNSIPLALVDRVEIVTGGASAAYGSDAVSGVVNIIMANQRDGFRASAQYGDTTAGTGSEYKLDLSYGFSFNEDRGHVIVGGNHDDMNAIGPQTSNPAYTWGVVSNPAFTPTNGQPRQLLRPNVFFAGGSLGGLIVGCAPTCGASGLAGLTFEPNGSSRPFQFGQFAGVGPGAVMSGGDVQATNNPYWVNLRSPVQRDNFYGRTTYDLSDNLRLKFDAFYSHSDGDSPLFPNGSGTFGGPALTVRSDNAFLPANIRTAMQNAGISSIQLGRANADWGGTQLGLTTDNRQATLGLEGKFADGWSWDMFYSYGESKLDSILANQPIAALFANSLDSVVAANGQPACRSAATNPACVPLNVFGYGVSSRAALDYFMGTASSLSDLSQHEASLILRGSPFSTWAGAVSIATGAEWRRQSLTTKGDAISATRGFMGLNPQSLSGSDTVTEGFLEADLPVARDLPLLKALNLNGAVRRSDYDRAGAVSSWKLGATDDLMTGLRLRFTRSRDIRAPNLNELFTGPTQNQQFVNDPVSNSTTTTLVLVGGNDDLRPERATSTTFGLVYQPTWGRGLNVSVDVFNINITDAITQPTGQQIVTLCQSGSAAYCSLITRNASNQITLINGAFTNLNEQTQKGADFEVSYPLDLATLAPWLRGRLSSRLLAVYTKEFSTFDGVSTVDNAGVVGSPTGIPQWRGNLDERYELGRFSANLRARYVGSGIRSGVSTIDVNYIPHQIYFDFGLEYRTSFLGNLALYGNLINLQDRAAPLNPNAALYDVIGRSFNVGARMDF